MKKRIIGLIVFAAVFCGALFLPAPSVMDENAFKALCTLALAVILWITEPIPSGAAAIFIIAIPSLLGLASIKATLSAFANPTLFFVIATFGLSAAISKVPLAKRILLFLLKLMGNSVNKLILAVMTATALISSVMSNIPATLMFMSACLSFLELYDNEEDKARTGRAIMISLPIAGMIGGCITPAGSSNNILALSLLEENTGYVISFVEWMIICAPLAIIMLPIAWFFIIKVFKPAPLSSERINIFVKELSSLGKPDKKERFVIAISIIMIALWIASSWISSLNTTLVAILGMVVMFLPGVDLFTWKEFQKEVSWSTILMTGCVLCLGSLISSSGVASLLADMFFKIDSGVSLAAMMLKLTAFMYIMQIILPNGPAAISTTAIPVMLAATSAGINPAVFIVPLCLYCSWAMILPLNPVPMLTYSTGYYKMTDISKVGLPVLIVLAAICLVWMPFITLVLF